MLGWYTKFRVELARLKTRLNVGKINVLNRWSKYCIGSITGQKKMCLYLKTCPKMPNNDTSKKIIRPFFDLSFLDESIFPKESDLNIRNVLYTRASSVILLSTCTIT